MLATLREREDEAVHIIREAAASYPNIALLWSMGKDSTTLLWLCRKAFLGRIPFPVVHIDTTYKFASMYAFRDRIAREWKLDLVVHRNVEALAGGMSPETHGRLACCTALKTEALREVVAIQGFDALIVGIRGDEHAVRAKERTYSPRAADFAWRYADQPPEFWDLYEERRVNVDHYRVHPILGWTEVDIWDYVRDQGIPLPDLYFATGGQRYRSIGCQRCTQPIASTASSVDMITEEVRSATTSERAGRAQDKEDAAAMQKLRALGYL